jgi:hypothetical protein
MLASVVEMKILSSSASTRAQQCRQTLLQKHVAVLYSAVEDVHPRDPLCRSSSTVFYLHG